MVGSIGVMRSIPAILGLLIAGAFFMPDTDAQRRLSRGSPLDTLGENPDQEQGWEILKTFRSMGWDGGYRWRIQLKIMPRRQKTVTLNGLMYGDRWDGSPVTRVDIVEKPADVDTQGELIESETLRLLFRSGRGAFAMTKRSSASGPPLVVDGSDVLEPIAGSEFALFDLMAPYVYWPRFRYEGRTTFRGSPTHLFWMYPPEEDLDLKDRIGGVRLYINDQFNVLIQTQVFDTEESLLKTIYISGIERVDGQAIFKEMDIRNDVTRNKTRLKIVDASMGLALPKNLFEAQSLMENLQAQNFAIGSEERFEVVE